MQIIDSHCHIYPRLSYFLKENSPKLPAVLYPLIKKIENFEDQHNSKKENLAKLATPIMNFLQKEQARFNNNSKENLFFKDQVFTLGSLTTLLSSNPSDHKILTEESGITKSLVIAHPPFISNDFILELANKNEEILPVINIPSTTLNVEELFKSYLQRGAVALKIHAAADGLDPMDEHYHKLLKLAEEHKLPVIIHTGCLEIEPMYKEPDFGHAEHFEQWFREYKTKFIMAHMNIHFPDVAIEFCKKYKNVFTDTSWQNERYILKAIKEVGSEKIMFGTDWPIIGNNIAVSLKRINNLHESEQITEKDYKNILSGTAKRVFKI